MAVLDLMCYYTCYQKWFNMTDLFSSGLSSNSIVIAEGKAANLFLKFCWTAVTRGAEASPRVSLLTLICGALVSDPPFPVGLRAACALRAALLTHCTCTTLLGRRCWVRALLGQPAHRPSALFRGEAPVPLKTGRFRELISEWSQPRFGI